MTADGNFVAEFLDRAQRAHASAIAYRQLQGDRAALVEFDALRAESERRLEHLAEAVALAAPELFCEHVRWTRAAFAARALPEELLVDNLLAVRDELAERLPPDLWTLTEPIVAAGIETAKDSVSATSDPRTDVAASPADDPSDGAADSRDSLHELALDYHRAILAADAELAKTLLRDAIVAAGGGKAILDRVIDGVLVPTQAQLGAGWQGGTSSIADEHFGTLVATELLTEFRLQRQRPTPNGRRLLATSVAGDFHQLGIQVVVDRFWSAGWQVDALGASTPMLDLIARAVRFRPDVIAISAALPTSVRATARLIEGLRLEPSLGDTAIMVGGGAFARLSDLWRKVGADLSASSAATAPLAVERWLAARDRADGPAADQGLTNR